ncbi:MAG: lipid-A-disaccharide synthase [Armatimonadota bacterium]
MAGNQNTVAKITVPSIAIVAGEASGDASGSALAVELRKLCPDISIWGAGGPRMRAAGIELVSDFSSVGAIGIVESLKLVPRLLGELAGLKREFCKRRPDVFVPIDFGAFNVKLGKFARKQGIPTVYYFPPGSWRKRPGKNSSLLAASDKIITPFPWSAEILAKAGADAHFLGHPHLDQVVPSMDIKQLIDAFDPGLDIPKGMRIVGILPGSRMHEIDNILPTMLKATSIIENEVPYKCCFIIAAGSDKAAGKINQILKDFKAGTNSFPENIYVLQGRTYDVMANSDLLISCSGTATLEAMILTTPMIIVYRGSSLMKIEYLFRKSILEQFIGMPNIVAGREICPELLGNQASPEKIAELAVKNLREPVELQRMKQALQSAREVLGVPGGTGRAAKVVLAAAGLLPRA